MLAQATGNTVLDLEPAVIVAFVVGVLAFVASGGLSWVFPSARAWRRIEQRAKILEQSHDKISAEATRALEKNIGDEILGQLSRTETSPNVAADDPSALRFGVQLFGLVVLSVAIGLAGFFAARDASSALEAVLVMGGFGIIAGLGLYGAARELWRRLQRPHLDGSASVGGQ